VDLFSQPVQIPTVSALTLRIKTLLEGSFRDVMVQGEVSQPKPSANGHVYFTLKDDGAQLPCVIWRSTAERLGLVLQHGQQVTVGGEIQVYAPSGRYQLIVNTVQIAGLGALQARFEALKVKLAAEGLFDPARKRRLPVFPARIGVVTSENGAAFHDIRNTLERRWPLAVVVLYHAAVQGNAAAPEIVRAITYFSESRSVDVIIAGRGGGSLEDLWPFNEEAVARAIYASKVPVISAVGHETDFSIADFVADVRAATPTQAAVLATPDQHDMRLYLDDVGRKTRRAINRRMEMSLLHISNLASSHLLRRMPMRLEQEAMRLQQLAARIQQEQQQRISGLDREVSELSLRLKTHNPDMPLEKGFARMMLQGKWIRSAKTLTVNDLADLHFQDGTVAVRVDAISPDFEEYSNH
jgi:exodeoxyribonuclease VII large subunit